MSVFRKIFLIAGGFERYRFVHLKADFLAGFTVALILIPQSMAYAQLAGLPSYYGLYASFLPPVLAALFGSSRQLATGPVAMVSLMTAVALEPLAIAGSSAYVAYAMLLSLMVGGFQIALGVLRLGVLVNLISHPVINGFTNAAALIIATSQLPKLLGIQVDKAARHYETMLRVADAAITYIHLPTVLIGGFSFLLMYTLRKLFPKIPSILAAVVLTTLISWMFGFEKKLSVDVTAIRYPEARTLIQQFNLALEHREGLTERRIRLAADLPSGRSDPLMLIDMQRDMALTDHKILQNEQALADIRARLRKMFLVNVSRADGTHVFYPESTRGEKVSADKAIWRFNVNNQPISLGEVVLSAGGEVVGTVPEGLPALQMPVIEPMVVVKLLPFCLIISLIGFMEAVSIAKAMAARTGQRIDPNRELIGQGVANAIGSLGRSYPCAGSFSRSAVNLQAGAISGLSSVFSSLVVVVTLFLFTPLLYHLPQSVLAAIIMVAVAGLVNFKGVIHAWRAKWYDGVIAVLTFFFTLAFAPHLERGIALGVALSLMVFVYKNMRPRVVDLSLGLDHALHDAVVFGLKECRYIDMVRFDGPLFFANASYLEEQIRHRRMIKKELKHIIIVSNGINDMDASGEEVLSLIVDRVRSAGIDISFSGVNEAVMSVFRRTHILAKIGEDHIYPSMKSAIRGVHVQTHRGASEGDCPLTKVVYSDRIDKQQ